MIINCTQHRTTSEQLAAGVVDFPEPERSELIKLLTFEELPTHIDIHERARKICALIDVVFDDAHKIMIGGAPYLMEPLSMELRKHGFVPVFAFSKRESTETIENGVCKKSSVFRHAGFIEAVMPRPQEVRK